MQNGIFALGNGSNVAVIGTSGKGKSRLLEVIATQNGITVEEAERLHATHSNDDTQGEFSKEEEKIQEIRLKNVRDAYWSSTPEEASDFYCMSDSCVEFLDIEPTREQLKIIFDSLPSQIIGEGIKWGFSDSVVRDNIYVFIQENVSELKTKLGI